MSDKGRTVQIITVVRFRVVSCHSGQRIGGYRHKQLLRRRGRTGRAHVRARDGCSAAIVRAWKAECAEEAAATSGGMQSSAAAQKDGGSGTPRALHDVVEHLFVVFLRLISAINAIPVTSSLVVDLHVA